MCKHKKAVHYTRRIAGSLKQLGTNKLKFKKPFHSTAKIINWKLQRNCRIINNAKMALMKIINNSLHASKEENKRLKNILNISSEKSIMGSAVNIPSIENMLSKEDLLEYSHEESSESGISFVHQYSFMVLESEPELTLTYLVLVERALNRLGIALPLRQNEKIIKGIWNILIKYWLDDYSLEEQAIDGRLASIYKDIDQRVQMGLLELLNFDLRPNRKEQILMQSRIASIHNIARVQ